MSDKAREEKMRSRRGSFAVNRNYNTVTVYYYKKPIITYDCDDEDDTVHISLDLPFDIMPYSDMDQAVQCMLTLIKHMLYFKSSIEAGKSPLKYGTYALETTLNDEIFLWKMGNDIDA